MSFAPVFDALTRGSDNGPGQLGVEDQSGAAAPGRNLFRGTSHIYIQAIEPELADDVCDLVEQLGRMPVDLCDNRTFDLGISEVSDQRVGREESGLDVNKLGKRNIGAAVPGRDKSKRGIGDSIHGGKTDDGLINLLPEIHNLRDQG